MKLIVLFISYVKAASILPTCIVGGGVTGLTLGHRFQERGVPVTIFESREVPGGKATTFRKDDIQVDIGPLLFSNNSHNSLALFKQYGFQVKGTPHIDYISFQAGTNRSQKMASIDLTEIQNMYTSKRSKLDLRPGYLNADPSLFISLGEWLFENNLKAFIPICQILVTASGYGSVFETPALYGLKIIDEHGNLNDPLYVVTTGLDKVFTAYAKDLNVKLNSKVTKIDSFENHTELHVETKGLKSIQMCDKVITTFPPMHTIMKQLISDSELLTALEPILVTKYASFVTINPNLSELAYFSTLDQKSQYPQEPPGQGHLTGMLRQGKAYASYSWYKGASKYPASNNETNTMYNLLINDINNLTNTINQTSIPYYRNWEYFPHANTQSLQQNFYQNIHLAQGTNRIYVAGTFLNFETIHYAIEGANYFFDTYF